MQGFCQPPGHGGLTCNSQTCNTPPCSRLVTPPKLPSSAVPAWPAPEPPVVIWLHLPSWKSWKKSGLTCYSIVGKKCGNAASFRFDVTACSVVHCCRGDHGNRLGKRRCSHCIVIKWRVFVWGPRSISKWASKQGHLAWRPKSSIHIAVRRRPGYTDVQDGRAHGNCSFSSCCAPDFTIMLSCSTGDLRSISVSGKPSNYSAKNASVCLRCEIPLNI